MISCGVCTASLDYAVFSSEGLIAASFYDRSLSTLKSIGASLSTDTVTAGDCRYASSKKEYQVFFSPVSYGKEMFYHAFAVNGACGKEFIITSEDRKETDFYNFLMGQFNLPLLESWSRELFSGAVSRNYIEVGGHVERGQYASSAMFADIPLEKLCIVRSYMTEEILKTLITELFKEGRIWISKEGQKPLEFKNMDQYFENYGHTLVDNLNRRIKPLHELDGNTDKLVFNNMRLYPQQVGVTNGITELLKNSHYGILNMGMGTGKTICSIAMAEQFFNQKYLKSHPGSTIKDVYKDGGRVHYRNIVMCPGHLVKKWKETIEKEVPFAKASIIEDLSQLIEIQANGSTRTGREWYVIGKDKAKLSYQSIPVPAKVGTKRLALRKCAVCGALSFNTRGREFHCSCGSTKFEKEPLQAYGTGMICPKCKEVCLPNGTYRADDEEEDCTQPLIPWDFTNPTSRNERCHMCGTELWKPFVRNINTPGTDFYEHAQRASKWRRVTHYANKTHHSKKSVWVHEDFKEEYFKLIGEVPLNERKAEDKGCRKYAPASYIKKHLKGYFDMFILDEAHLFKGGATAQGNAMQALVSASCYQLALTGTIAGGMATDLFYLLFRLDPARMRSYGYQWGSVMPFAEKYGTIETLYSCGDNEKESSYNTTSRGRVLTQPRVKPGISPLIFRDFLLDKTVFLDLSDMSKYLPKLVEKVELVDVPDTVECADGSVIDNPETYMLRSYYRVIKTLKAAAKQGGEGRGVLSKMLQFSLSYLDHPYGVVPIKSPFSGGIICTPDNYPELIEDGGLLEKEKRLVSICRQELSEGRNAVVYVEFTGNPETCVTHRLQEVLMKDCNLAENEVVIIESTSPCASKREEWMHTQAQKGAKIFIVQPKCVETGLDFCWMGDDGVLYNYPTLIFYQLGYSLFTVWQASRRAFRLNQREECRNYYIAYRGTVQQAVIQLIAEKQVATSAIQGKFSTEGLSAMAQGVDVKVRLAQAMSELDSSTGNGLQEMFDVLQQEDDAEDMLDASYVPMLTYAELMGEDAEDVSVSAEDMNSSVPDFKAMFTNSLFEEFVQKFASAVSDASEKKKKPSRKAAKKVAMTGHVDFFSLVG